MAETAPRWHWRNCRSIGLQFECWPLDWRLGFKRNADVYGGWWSLAIGPFAATLNANIGNTSSKNRFEAWLGLSEVEAHDRALKYEGHADG